MAARYQPRVLDHLFGADSADCAVRRKAARLHRLPDCAAARDDGPPGPQSGLHPADSGERARGTGRRRPRHRSLRRLRHGRQFRHRHHRFRDPDDRQLRRHHQRLGAHRRGVRPLHPGCDAGQADGDRRRSLRRLDHRGGRARTASPPGGGKQLLRRHGRCRQVRPRRCDRRADDHLHQHRRRHHHRRRPTGPGLQRGGRRVYAADRRRRLGDTGSGADRLDRRRHHRHQGRAHRQDREGLGRRNSMATRRCWA
jgi:hypothetical protein